MKATTPLLIITLLFNGILVASLVFVLTQRPATAPVLPTPLPATTPISSPAVVPVQAHPEPKPFRWSQLESKDYRTYVRNLRASGCPEISVRAIVTADVHAVFAKRYEVLDQKLAELAGASWSVRLGALNSEQALKTERQLLPGAEAAEINDLLGLKPAANASPADLAATTSEIENSQPPVALPLAFQTIDPAALSLTTDQIAIINDVRQSFLKEIGGENQNPDDPAYLERWQKAQPAADDMLRLMLGVNFFENYQMAALGRAQ